MKLTHATRYLDFTGRLHYQTRRASVMPIPVQRFTSKVISTAKLNRAYIINEQTPSSFKAIKVPEYFEVSFRVIKHVGMYWAQLQIAYEGEAPTLTQLDKIAEDLFGRGTYCMIVYHPKISIIHCIDQQVLPLPEHRNGG